MFSFFFHTYIYIYIYIYKYIYIYIHVYLYLSKEEEEKKWQYGRECYKNPSKNEKQRLVQYRKNIIKWEEKILFYMLLYNEKYKKSLIRYLKFLLKYKTFFKVGARKFLFLKYKKNLRAWKVFSWNTKRF